MQVETKKYNIKKRLSVASMNKLKKLLCKMWYSTVITGFLQGYGKASCWEKVAAKGLAGKKHACKSLNLVSSGTF